ncbi:hypothetical protein TetV_513 [Tetraselmis virus 1]|uniref:Uncharacterized protein n=1 Tax=Tetraselmis virus 1 TaxID=2060617 RepID=A0A2P0VNV7_9VIRU|nr:hypothetical protein QJ968_gp541 [Tetraselmis virus 1]AUF82595.1 hypothetical protein TetV_513 [Tetraselmis virus 1]
MRTVTGIFNALLVLFVIIALHIFIIQNPVIQHPVQPHTNESSFTKARRERRKRMSTPLKDLPKSPGMTLEDVYAWPPSPYEVQNKIPIDASRPQLQKPYTSDVEDRMALHKLVFSKDEPDDMFRNIEPKKPKDYSRPDLSAEGGTTTGLFRIREEIQNKKGLNDDISGMEGWGASFAVV